MVRLLARVMGIGVETADLLVQEVAVGNLRTKAKIMGRGRSQCGLGTTVPRHCPSGTGEIATLIESCHAEPEDSRIAPALSRGASFRSRRASQ